MGKITRVKEKVEQLKENLRAGTRKRSALNYHVIPACDLPHTVADAARATHCFPLWSRRKPKRRAQWGGLCLERKEEKFQVGLVEENIV